MKVVLSLIALAMVSACTHRGGDGTSDLGIEKGGVSGVGFGAGAGAGTSGVGTSGSLGSGSTGSTGGLGSGFGTGSSIGGIGGGFGGRR